MLSAPKPLKPRRRYELCLLILFFVEGVADGVQIGFRLTHDRAGNTRENVLQTLGRVDAAKRPGRVADDAGRLAQERTLAVRARGDIDGVLQYAGNGAVVLRRDEDDAR